MPDGLAAATEMLRRDGAPAPPYVAIDPRLFRRLADFEARFPHGPPSLARRERLVVDGDVTFA